MWIRPKFDPMSIALKSVAVCFSNPCLPR
jgi:hypothetical protein